MTEPIVPDDKDWTWVLERECGFDARSLHVGTVGDLIRTTAASWVAVLAGDEASDPAMVAVELVSAAEALAVAFDGVEGAQWSRPGRRSDGASFTVESFARYMIHDPVHHLRDCGVDLQSEA